MAPEADTAGDEATAGLVEVGPLDVLERDGVRVVRTGEGAVAVFAHEGRTYAVDNRCPHMGFPLHRGTVRDGILTCHWHHARFELSGGCTFDPWADDVVTYRSLVRDGVVWLDPTPAGTDPHAHWTAKLDEGLEQDITLVLAKAAVALEEIDAEGEALTRAALFGVRNREAGWSSGLSILTALGNVLDVLDPRDRSLALTHGLRHVARSTADEPPSFDLQPLTTDETRPERYRDWFRRFVEVRGTDAAERTLRTAIRIRLPATEVAGMVFAACTDHLFLDVGHTLDFANKAFELLDLIGWEHAEEVLPAIVPNLVSARRMEEAPSWRHPVDLAALLDDARAGIADDLDAGGGTDGGWADHVALAEVVLDGEPEEILGTLREVIRGGAPVTEVATAVAYAAARRPVHFPVSNELSDWDTVHHTFTYANAVDQALRRAPSLLLARGVLDAAMSVHLERFLNVPKRPRPQASGAARGVEEVLALLDRQGHVDETGQAVADLLATAGAETTIATLGHALLREDAGFHAFQIFEAGVRQHRNLAPGAAADDVLIGMTRFLAAHSPTVRSLTQTHRIAQRLHRGETIHEDLGRAEEGEAAGHAGRPDRAG